MDQISGATVWILGAAALVTAGGVLWKKIIQPLAKFITYSEQMLPLLRDLTETFKGTPHAFKILDEIVAQVRTDSGSSLLDAINRIEASTSANQEAAQVAALVADSLRVGVETVKQLAQIDRERLQELVLLLDRLRYQLENNTMITERIEIEGGRVRLELDASQQRAAETTSTEAGAAADAAALPDDGH